MLPESSPSLKNPLFFKIALVFVLTSAAVLSATVAFLYMQYPRPDNRVRRVFRKNIALYFDQVTRNLGEPPDTAKAAKEAEALDLGIRIQGPGLHWVSSEKVPEIEEVEFDEAGEAPGLNTGRAGERLVCIISRGNFKVLYAFPGRPVFSLPLRQSLILIGLIALILALSYATVRLLLIPVVRARERLLIGVSHELRSPLARTKVALAMLPKSGHREAISRAASEMETMLTEILETERMKSSHGALSKFPMNIFSLASELAKAYSNVKIIRPGRLSEIQGDAAKITIVLKNLIENALKYSQKSRRSVEISFGEDPAWVRAQVKDFGSGIPKADLPHIFEPFYRVDKSRTKRTGGYGLGLSLCREIMRAHRGDILIESREGSGTEVTLKFPKG
jgi:signal transduction histidine kinase